MSTRIGLAVAYDAVRAIAIRDKRIIWTGEAPFATREELPGAIATLLGQAPLPRWPRPILHAAIGPHGAQVKRVAGLPEIGDADALAAIIREAVGTYFLKNGVALVTTGVRPGAAGTAVAAALDRDYVDAIRAAGRARGYRIGPITPTAVALPRAFEDPTFRWNDGALTVEISRSGTVLDTVRTRPARAEDRGATPSSTVPELAALGADAMRYADAFGAAALDPREPLALQPESPGLAAMTPSRRSLLLLGLILAIGVAVVGLSPLAAVWAGKRAVADVAQLRPGRWQVISTARGQLDQVGAVLREARSFGDSRVSVGTLLGDLARQLPNESALLSFEWTGDRGEITVLTNNPAVVLAALQRVPRIGSIEMVDGITRQSVRGRELQRVSIRFAARTS